CFFFFFQAEDGIRDRNVTGVQTCALPISLALTAPGLTFGAALSNGTRDFPCASFPVTTRRMGRSFSVMGFYSIQLQVRLPHDRCVSVVLSPEELGVLPGRVTRRLLAQGEEAFPDFGNLEDL